MHLEKIMSAFFIFMVLFFSSVFSNDGDDLKKIEQFLSLMSTLEADMTMEIQSGAENAVTERFEGKIWLDRHNGFLRINYGSNVILAKGGVLFVHQENQDLQKFDTQDTPAGILLRSKISFDEKGIAVKSFTKIKELWQLFLTYDSPIGQVPVTLYFKPFPVMILLGWTIQNPDGSVTNVHLDPEKTHMAVAINQSIFSLK